MIAPTKHLTLKRSLLGVGADILSLVDAPMSISSLWDRFKEIRGPEESNRIPFEWFILAIDMLYLLGAVEYRRGRLVRSES